MLSFAVTVEKKTKIIEMPDGFTMSELCEAIITRFEGESDVTVKDLEYFDKDFNLFIDVDESMMSKLADRTRLECTLQSTKVSAVFSNEPDGIPMSDDGSMPGIVPNPEVNRMVYRPTSTAPSEKNDIEDTHPEPESDELEYGKKDNHCSTWKIIRRRFDNIIRIANATNKPIMVKVTQNRMDLKQLSFEGKLDVNIQGVGKVEGECKPAWEMTLHEARFCKIGPLASLPFRVSKLRKKIFISLYEENIDKPQYDNYSPPKGNFVYTASGLLPSKDDKPFDPNITPYQAALIAGTDPKLARKTSHECGIDPKTGAAICWPTVQKGAGKDRSRNNS